MQSNDSEKKKLGHRHAVRGIKRAASKEDRPAAEAEVKAAAESFAAAAPEEIAEKPAASVETAPAEKTPEAISATEETAADKAVTEDTDANENGDSSETAPEDAESQDDGDDQYSEDKGSKGGIFKVGAVLLSICAVVTLVLSLVNFLTFDAAQANKKKEIDIAISSMFPKSTSSIEVETEYGDPISGVYKVMENDTHIGYAVGTTANGFGGKIEMLVGIENGGKIRGVKIISLSETPNVGSRVDDEEYLSGYKGKSGILKLKEDIDAISGASISSRAVLAGVNSVMQLGLDVEGRETEDGEDTSEADNTETGRLEPDPELETLPVDGDVPDASYDTYFRAETAVPEEVPDDTSILEIVPVPSEEN
ncbi:MAG: FMN-binding protein [Clostridia bacterium]|nr:FMN-binding protein [Clostridia bacterium]